MNTMNTAVFTVSARGVSMPLWQLNKFLGKSQVRQLTKSLKITVHQKIGAPQVRKIYKVEPGPGDGPGHVAADGTPYSAMFLPRMFVTKLGAAPLQIRPGRLIPLEGPDRPLPPASLYESHEVVVDFIMRKVFNIERARTGRASASFEMRAGTGKTFVAAGLVVRLKQRTLMIVPKVPLVRQAANDFRHCYGMPVVEDDIEDGDSIGDGDVVLPKIIEWESGKKGMAEMADTADVVIMVINSALLRPPEFFAGFGLVVFDEVHEYCTDKRAEVFWKTAAVPYLFGMTATPDKPFGGVFRFHLGSVLHAEKIPGFEYPVNNFHGIVRQIHWHGPDSHSRNLTHPSTDQIFTQYMHEQAVDDAARLQLAVQELRTLYNWRGPDGQKHHIYVFAEQISILETLRVAFRKILLANDNDADLANDLFAPELPDIERAERGIRPGETSGPRRARYENADGTVMFTGGIQRDELEHVANHSRVLFTTYGYGGTGISYTKMSAMMFFTSRRANMIQILGRIFRSGGDESIPRVVVDFVDKRTALQWQRRSRQPAYDLYGLPVQVIKAYHDRPFPLWDGTVAAVEEEIQITHFD